MLPVRKIILFLVILGIFSPLMKAQQDSLAVDSIVTRINALLNAYNERTLYVDTSDYVTGGYSADNINLQIASSLGACNEIVRLVIKGADVNNMDGGVATPLHYAVASGSKLAVEILLLLGALPDKYDVYGNTPLISAVRSNDLDMSELLIRYGAPVSQADRFNSTPLHHAVALGFFYIADMLLYYDAPTDTRDVEGNTPLMAGVSFGYYDICDLLLQNGADPNAADRKGFTPLMAAAQNGDTLLLRMLTDAGANLYAFNKEGLDALGCAARNGNRSAVTFLLQAGNRWQYTNENLKHPMDLAEYYGQRDIIPLLREYGINRQKKEFTLDRLTLSAGAMFTSHYLLLTGSATLTNPELKYGISAGVAFNPFNYQLLVHGSDGVIYQYRVNTSVISAGIFREFTLRKNFGNSKLSFVPSLSAGYRFYSKYAGTNDKPDDSFCLIPSAEMKWNIQNIGFSAGMTYLKTPYYKVSPAWFSLKISYAIGKTSSGASAKKIKLYYYEQN
jgi:ankyrin repeat protein